jgi:MFS family permease
MSFLPQLRLPARETELQRNSWNLSLEIAFFGVLFGLLQTFLSVYVIRLGGNNNVIGVLTAMTPFILTLCSFPAARLVERAPSRMKFILVTATLHRMGALALGVMPWLITAHQPEAVVVIVALMTVPQTMASIAFSAMFADVIPNEQRAQVVAARSTLLGLSTTLAAFIGGQFLGLLPTTGIAWLDALFTFPLNYQSMFIAGFVISMVSVYFLSRITGGDSVTQPTTTAAQSGAVRGSVMTRLQPTFSMLRQYPLFTRYALSMFIAHWGVFLPIPLYAIYWVRHLQASDNFVGLILAVQSLTTMVVYPILPRFVATMGNRQLVALSTFLMASYPLATALTTTLEPLLLVAVLGGVSGAAFSLSTFNLLLEVTPQERRASFIAIFTAAVNSAGFVAPFIGTALLAVIGIREDLFIGFALRFIGFLTFVWMVGVKRASGVQVSRDARVKYEDITRDADT